jgi:hypothetical protein
MSSTNGSESEASKSAAKKVSQLISGQKRNSVNLPCQWEVKARTGCKKHARMWNYVHCDPLDHIALSVVIALPQTTQAASSQPQSLQVSKKSREHPC